MAEYLQKFKTSYTQADGLSSNDIRAIVVDKMNRVWAGTVDGLCQLNGETWETVLPVNGLSTLYADATGQVWIGVGNQLLNINGETVFQASGPIQNITADALGQIWVASDHQICCLSGGRRQRFDLSGGDGMRAVRLDAEQRVLIATAAGLIRCDSEGEQRYTTENSGALSNDVRCIEIDAHGHLWVGTDRGVAIFDGKQTWYAITGANGGLPYEDVRQIVFGAQGQCWIGTGIGAALWCNGKWEYYAGQRWLAADGVAAIGVQQDGTAWIGTPEGLSKIEKKPYTLDEKTMDFEERIQARHNR